MPSKPSRICCRLRGLTPGFFAVLLALPGSPLPGWAQTASGKAAATPAASAGDSARGLGFSIESEMLTYRALESNSDAVACDVAAYVNGTVADFSHPPAGAVCDVGGSTGKSGVIVVPFDRTLFDAFQFWRAEIQVMHMLRSRALPYQCESATLAITGRGSASAGTQKAASQSTGTTAASAAKAAFDLTPYGTALQLSQSLLGMFAQNPINTAVAGTIDDQAFIDGVARGLRSFNVPVLAPATYSPFTLAPVDVERSPFLTGVSQLVATRSCLAAKEAGGDLGPLDKALARDLGADIDAYLAAFGATRSAAGSEGAPGGTPKPASDKVGGPVPDKSGSGKPDAAAPAGLAPATALMTMLAGDDLARALGVDPDTLQLAAAARWQHVLLLKALESGGTLESKSNIFGSKVRFSGGSVGTYALFSLDGHLECSGNVYEFGGSIRSENFQRELREYRPDPQSQFIFKHGGCRAPPAGH